MQDILSRVFVEAFLSSLIWPLSGEMYYFALQGFGETDMSLPTYAAIAGGVLAGYANFLLGVLASNAQKAKVPPLDEDKYLNWRDKLDFFVWFFGLASCLNILAFTLVICGYFRVSHWKVLLSVLIGQTGYYVFYYYLDIQSAAS